MKIGHGRLFGKKRHFQASAGQLSFGCWFCLNQKHFTFSFKKRSALISHCGCITTIYTDTQFFFQSRTIYSTTKKNENILSQQKHIFDGIKVRQPSALNSGEINIQPGYAQSQTLKTPNNSKARVCSYIFQTDQFS